MRAAVASAARLKPYDGGEQTSRSWAGAAYGGEEGVAGQVRKVGAEAAIALEWRMLRELLRWGARIGGVHGQAR
jgi:hypothetical protein